MATVYLGLGSNVDPERHLRAGIAALRDAFGEVALSPVYRSAAVGFEGGDFLNLAARVDTVMSPRELKTWLTALEEAHGRRRDLPALQSGFMRLLRFLRSKRSDSRIPHPSDRTLDIDILLYGDQVSQQDDDGVELPRREILKYAHVLKPLADLAPELPHPQTGRAIGEHWREFSGDAVLVEQKPDGI